LIMGTMTFGDEISILTIADAFSDKPQMLFGTKSNRYRRAAAVHRTRSAAPSQFPPVCTAGKFPSFSRAGFSGEKNFQQCAADFVRTCSVVKGFIGAKIGFIGPRPEAFETVIFNEDA